MISASGLFRSVSLAWVSSTHVARDKGRRWRSGIGNGMGSGSRVIKRLIYGTLSWWGEEGGSALQYIGGLAA